MTNALAASIVVLCLPWLTRANVLPGVVEGFLEVAKTYRKNGLPVRAAIVFRDRRVQFE